MNKVTSSRCVVIIQARLGATRFYGKPLKEVLEKPLLFYVVDRCRHASLVNEVVVATTTHSRDDQIVSFCQNTKIPCVRGSEEDVLSRYVLAAKKTDAEVIVRITADCPLVDPEVIDKVLSQYEKESCDYISNTLDRTFPRGLDVEVFSRNALEQADQESSSLHEREHVTLYLYSHPEKFRLKNVIHSPDLSNYRLTVDTPQDFELIKLMLETLYPQNPYFNLNDMIKQLKLHPEWKNINSFIQQKKV